MINLPEYSLLEEWKRRAEARENDVTLFQY
jgi:hypothetical protein